MVDVALKLFFSGFLLGQKTVSLSIVGNGEVLLRQSRSLVSVEYEQIATCVRDDILAQVDKDVVALVYCVTADRSIQL
jgi:hypothetical protein